MGPIAPDDLRFNRFGLSQQESRVLAFAMSGRIDKQIAAEMGISLGTVRVYWKRIRQKVGGTRSETIAELARTSLKLNFDDERGRSIALASQLEESLVRERALRVYESAFATLPSPLAILDSPMGKIMRVNETFASLHGYEVDELEAMPSQSLMKPDEVAALDKAAHAAARKDESFEIDSTRIRKDGTTFNARVMYSGGDDAWVLAIKI